MTSKPGMKKMSVRKKIESTERSQTTKPISKPAPQAFQARKLIKPKSKISIISKSLILEKCPKDAWFNIKDMISKANGKINFLSRNGGGESCFMLRKLDPGCFELKYQR